jgi:UDP-N-acetylmuramate: L-alanyl-gamma-D-glutamyl-meso-diaminopimelate ligase
LVGISGTGMGALAGLFVEAGHEVSGSDIAFEPPIGPALAALGIPCLRGYDPSHLDPRPDLVVVGNAIRRDNPEASAAERLGLARTSMSSALREHFLAKRRALVVAGTHGKTTTSAMCTWLLVKAGMSPGWFIGGIPKGLAAAAVGDARIRPDRGRGPFVIEGDEYDAVYWHKQPKFLDYVGVSPEDVVIVTSVEHDHIDIYPDAPSYEAAFRELVARTPTRGLIVCDAHDARARAIVSGSPARVVYYGLERDATGDVTPTWHAAPAHVLPGGLQAFDLFVGGMACGRFTLAVPGQHNIRNALAALAACVEGFGARLDEARASLVSFEGVKRRQDLLGEPDGVRVYDDFAHHPTAVDETLRALRSRHPDGQLWVAFEPRSATACRALHQEAYARAFDVADRVLLAPLGRTNVPEPERLDLQRLARELGEKAMAAADVDAILASLVSGARPGDTIALLSNGAFGDLHARLLTSLQSRRSGS